MKHILIILLLSCTKATLQPPCKQVQGLWFKYDVKWKLIDQGEQFNWKYCNYEWRQFERKSNDTCNLESGEKIVYTFKILN